MTGTWKGLALVAAFAAALAPRAQGQTAPPGYIYDFNSVFPGNLSTYQLFSTSFTASVSTTTVSFAFREVPAYWGFDDVSVFDATTSGGNLLVDPGFEAATVTSVFPNGWGRWIQPVDVSAIGEVASTASPYGCTFYGPNSGSQFWCDGSVEGYDALYQTMNTTIGDTYTISWAMSDNSGQDTSNPDIDMFVYAQAGIPIGTIPQGPVPPVIGTPEPATWSLMATGLVGLIGVTRRRRTARAK